MPQYTLSGAVRGYIVITLTLPGLCPAQTLHCAGYGARTANLENAVDFTDINPKLHGGGGAQKAEFSLSQRLFRFHPLFF
jgi:hypothetical protein